MSELKSKVQVDDSLSTAIDSIACRMLASLFYFGLESMPEKMNGRFGDNSFLDSDGNFRKRVELSVSDKFTICLKQAIQRLILAQSLHAYLGTADHRKRKRTEEQVQRTEGSIN
ncbi:hypothetical protein H2202_001355 [Exophiala xenobiotica]|nr:hypothetical protein H2202_001355 [Exophiala xenobiotica]